jgi:hypothetical protein
MHTGTSHQKMDAQHNSFNFLKVVSILMIFGGAAGKVEILCHARPGGGDPGKWPGQNNIVLEQNELLLRQNKRLLE